MGCSVFCPNQTVSTLVVDQFVREKSGNNNMIREARMLNFVTMYLSSRLIEFFCGIIIQGKGVVDVVKKKGL